MVPQSKISDAGNLDILLLCLIYELYHRYVCIGKKQYV